MCGIFCCDESLRARPEPASHVSVAASALFPLSQSCQRESERGRKKEEAGNFAAELRPLELLLTGKKWFSIKGLMVETNAPGTLLCVVVVVGQWQLEEGPSGSACN